MRAYDPTRWKETTNIIQRALVANGHKATLLTQGFGEPFGSFACWDIDQVEVVSMILEENGTVTLMSFPGKHPIERFGSLKSMAFYLEPESTDAQA